MAKQFSKVELADAVRQAYHKADDVNAELIKSTNPQCLEVAYRAQGRASAYLAVLDWLEGRGHWMLDVDRSGRLDRPEGAVPEFKVA